MKTNQRLNSPDRHNQKLAICESKNKIPIDLYNRLNRRWKQIIEEEKDIRNGTFAKVMPDMFQEHKDTFLDIYKNIFIPKFRIFMILQNKIEAIIQ